MKDRVTATDCIDFNKKLEEKILETARKISIMLIPITQKALQTPDVKWFSLKKNTEDDKGAQ